MASTLQQLLQRQRSGRVQTGDLPEPRVLQAAIRSGGQYNVQVQQAGKSKLTELAEGLSKINPALNEYARIGEIQGQIGVEKALAVSDKDVMEELRKNEPDTFLTVKRHRAFRDVLLKRVINNQILPSLEAEAGELLDLDKHKNQREFLGAVDDKMNDKWSHFRSEVGDEIAQSDAAKILWNAVTGPYRNDMLKSYVKQMDDFNVAGQSEELGIELDVFGRKRVDGATGQPLKLDPAGLQEIAKQREKLLKEAGITDKALRSKVIVDGYAKQVDALYAAGRYTDAERMLAAMQVIQVNGKPIFRTTAAKQVLNPIVSKLNYKLNQSTGETDARKGRRFANKVVAATHGLRLVQTQDEASANTLEQIKDTFISLNPSLGEDPKALDELVEQVFTGTGAPLNQYNDMLNTLANNGGDEADTLYFDNYDNINRGLEAAVSRPLPPAVLTSDFKKAEIEEFNEWHSKNKTGDWKDFINEENKNYRAFPELVTASAEANKGNYVMDTGTYKSLSTILKGKIGEVEDELGDELEIDLGTAFHAYALPIIQERILGRAGDWSDLPEDERNQKIKDLATRLLDEEKERFEGRVNATLIEMDAIKPSQKKLLEESPSSVKGRTKREKGRTYTSLASPSPQRSLINSDRQRMLSNRDLKQLGRSLFEFGFNSYSKESAKLLEEAGLDAGDVRLFGSQAELNGVASPWAEVLQKDIQLETLTDDEKETRDEFQAFGVYDLPTFELFYNLQQTLLSP